MSNALGAYFGTTRIVQGAGGLGADDGVLQAYADGSVGGREANPEMPGPLTSYHDGSLGRMVHQYGGGDSGELQAWADGVVGGNAPDAWGGQLFAYHDGSLGDEASPATVGDDISAYHDGSLGDRRNQVLRMGPLQAFQDGSLGAYAAAIGAAAENVLDLGDANVLKELKIAMSLIAPEQTLTMDGIKVYTPDWYTNGIWDPQASLLWQYIVSKTSAFKGKTVSVEMGAQSYPNATGIGFMVAALAAPQSGTYGPDYVKKNMPALYAWFSAGGGTVLPPYLSLTDKTKGVRGEAASTMKMSTVAFAGLGAVALFGIALALRKKR